MNDIGGWRVSKEECPPSKQPDYVVVYNARTELVNNKFVEHEPVKVTEHITTRLKINDEWNVDKICNNIVTYKRVVIRADLPGSGKSYACKHLQNLGYNVLMVCPTRKLSREYKGFGVTAHKFFGLGIINNEKITSFDYTSYNVVVFDEIYFLSVRLLAQIKKFCENNPDILVVATGDTSQLPPIVDYTNTKIYKEYADKCINLIFPYEIYLTENKRLKTEEDRKKLKQLKEDVFNENIKLETTIQKIL
jgi:hypothetical protein